MSKMICWDLETTGDHLGAGLMPWHKDSRIRSVAYATLEDGKGHTWSEADPTIESIENTLKEYDTFVGWNLQFDVAWLLAKGASRDLMFGANYLDGIHAWYIHNKADKLYRKEELKEMWKQDLSYSLKQAVREFVPEFANYEEGIDYDNSSIKELLEYNEVDVKVTMALTKKFYEEVSMKERLAILDLGASIPMVADSWQRGIQIDRHALSTLNAENTQALEDIAHKLGVNKTVVASPTKLKFLLFTEMGLTPPKDHKNSHNTGDFVPMLTDKGWKDWKRTGLWDVNMVSTDKLALTVMGDEGTDLCYGLAEMKGMLTKQSKFVKAVVDSLDYNADGKTYPSPKIHGTYTGRMTYGSKTTTQGPRGKKYLKTGIALHQWQRDPRVRRLLQPPEGYMLAELDAAGQEYALMAHYSQDPVMMDILHTGKNSHSVMGANIAGRDYDEFMSCKGDTSYENQRKLGKLANLSLQYRTSSWTLRDRARSGFDTVLTKQECDRITETYHATYQGVKRYWDAAITQARINGYAETAGGRRVALNFAGGSTWRQDSTAINYPIQGTGADMKTLALRVLRDYCHQWGVLFAWDLHDGLFFYVPKSQHTKSIVRQMKHTLDTIDYPAYWSGWAPSVPLLWDASLGQSWDTLEELK